MRSVRLLALSAAMLVAASALAQSSDSFPDVPRNHWAYAALARMKADGLLVGYPDGLYRGGRPMSRYELAVALHAAYVKLKNQTDGLDAQVRALQSPGLSGNGKADLEALRSALEGLRADLAGMKRYGAEIADLQRASDTFELELTQLGVDAQAMKDELKGLAGRVGALEKKQDPIEIGGEIDLWAGGGHGGKNDFGLTRDGRITGVADKGPLAADSRRAGITDDLAFLQEAALDFKTTNETGIKVRGTLVATNAFGQNPVNGVVTTHIGFGNQSDVFNPTGGFARYGYAEGSGDLYLQDLVISGSSKGVDLEGGRLETKATPWILQRIDNTLYFDNERWDDGLYTYDGVKAATHIGPVKTVVYGGVDQEQSVNGVRIDTLRSGPVNGFRNAGAAIESRLEAGRLLGATLTTNLKGIGLRGDWLVLDGDEAALSPRGEFDQLQVYGGEADAHLGPFRLSGGLRQTAGRFGGARVDGLEGNAWDATLGWAGGRVDLSAQYREVQTNYLAPGDWGRLGVLRNPTNIRGGIGKAKVGILPRLDFSLEGELSHGLSNSGASGTALDRGTDIGRFSLRLDERFGRDWDGYVYYEQTHFSDLAPLSPAEASVGDSRYQWYGVGVAHRLGGNARFTLAYEQSAVRHDYQTSNGDDYRGGFLTSQVTVKF